MLKLSGLVINFDKSRDYFALLIIISIFGVLLSYSADVEIKYVYMFAIILFLQIIKASKTRMPHPELESISYTGRDWSIKLKDGGVYKYDKIKIRLDSGFFILVAFYNGKKSKNIVIFNDQIPDISRRHMFLIAKVCNNG